MVGFPPPAHPFLIPGDGPWGYSGSMAGSKPFDDVDPVRRRTMQAVRGRDTRLEMGVRRALHALGYRYRVHDKRLPGRPDLVFASRQKVVFLHGCFWHAHENCALARAPKTRTEFWGPKLARNRQRDAESLAALKAAGWRAIVVWECETKRDAERALQRIRRFLGPPGIDGRLR